MGETLYALAGNSLHTLFLHEDLPSEDLLKDRLPTHFPNIGIRCTIKLMQEYLVSLSER